MNSTPKLYYDINKIKKGLEEDKEVLVVYKYFFNYIEYKLKSVNYKPNPENDSNALFIYEIINMTSNEIKRDIALYLKYFNKSKEQLKELKLRQHKLINNLNLINDSRLSSRICSPFRAYNL